MDSPKLAALKTVHPQLVGDDGFRQRFQREANAVRSVRSPRVAELVDHDLSSHPAYLAFEYIEGPTLYQQIQRYGVIRGDVLVGFAAR